MSTSLTSFLNASAADASVIEPGQSLSAARLTFWREQFNALVENMSADRYFLFYVPNAQYVCSNLESHEIGPGAAQFDTTPGSYVRPVFVESARVIVGSARRWPLNMQTETEWASNPRRGSTDPDGPIDFYYAAGISKGTFNMAPKPSAGQILILSQWNPLKTFTSAEMSVDIELYYPLEYIRAMRLNLAAANLPAHRMSATQEFVANAQAALETIRTLNKQRVMGKGETALVQGG